MNIIAVFFVIVSAINLSSAYPKKSFVGNATAENIKAAELFKNLGNSAGAVYVAVSSGINVKICLENLIKDTKDLKDFFTYLAPKFVHLVNGINVKDIFLNVNIPMTETISLMENDLLSVTDGHVTSPFKGSVINVTKQTKKIYDAIACAGTGFVASFTLGTNVTGSLRTMSKALLGELVFIAALSGQFTGTINNFDIKKFIAYMTTAGDQWRAMADGNAVLSSIYDETGKIFKTLSDAVGKLPKVEVKLQI